MPTRYQQLRKIVVALASPASEQSRYLDEIFASLDGRGSAAGYGNDELALELEDMFFAASDMIEHDELTELERDAIRPLSALLESWSGLENAQFWQREALFSDPRWVEIRACATKALASLPDEGRAVGRSSK